MEDTECQIIAGGWGCGSVNILLFAEDDLAVFNSFTESDTLIGNKMLYFSTVQRETTRKREWKGMSLGA